MGDQLLPHISLGQQQQADSTQQQTWTVVPLASVEGKALSLGPFKLKVWQTGPSVPLSLRWQYRRLLFGMSLWGSMSRTMRGG